ncbi:uncharacterized protein [Diabrotica undecimpunctata]|uniref:uncharacterized protein n=1 Tax=Diabrotica undecimpunctata TaxID=50387 RepID=UPI003B6360E8
MMAAPQKYNRKRILAERELEAILAESDFFLSEDSDNDCSKNENVSENLSTVFHENETNAQNHLENDSDSERDSDDDAPLLQRWEKLQETEQLDDVKSRWNKNIFETQDSDAADLWIANEDHEFWTPLDYFSEYFPEHFWENLSSASNIKAMQANEKKNLRSTPEEFKKLTGIHVLMGIFGLPRLRLYFMKGISIPIITQLPRDRIYKLRNFLYVVDNCKDSEDTKKANKLWKVQPILDVVRNKCITLQRSRELSIDEQMIPFTGTTSLLQYVKNKPNPVGLKNVVLASKTGPVLDFFIYQGANTWPDAAPDKSLGIGGSVVKKLSANLCPGKTIS